MRLTRQAIAVSLALLVLVVAGLGCARASEPKAIEVPAGGNAKTNAAPEILRPD